MKAVFEKIIERLEEEAINCMLPDGFRSRCVNMNTIRTVVKEVAEEYVPDNNDGNNDGWIPCSERLPDRYCHCLVTRRNDYEDGSFDSDVREDVYIELEGVWDWQSKFEGLIDNIIAWQPLPAPYKPKGE